MAGFGRLEGIRGMLRFDLCFFFCVFLPGYVTFMYYYAVTILDPRCVIVFLRMDIFKLLKQQKDYLLYNNAVLLTNMSRS